MPRAALSLLSGFLLMLGTWHSYAFASGTPDGVPRHAISGPLHGVGARLVDDQGQEVRITGVNWFGLETDTFAPHGLWARNYGDILDQIAATGFNTIRLPFSNELLESSSIPKGIDFQKNPDLRNLTGLQVMDRVVDAAGQRGLGVILDRHRPTASGQSELWYTARVPEVRWVEDWRMLAQHYAANPTIIAADLHNEPHGPATWGDGNPTTDWRLAAERAGNAILAVNPGWLILVEGIEHYGNDWYWWGGNLVGARSAPIRLSAPNKLVYSTHDYGPGVYQQKWFGAPDFPANLPGVWRDHWAFLHQDNIAPLLVGEFGGRSVGSDAEGTWQRNLLAFMRDNNLSYTYWAWNPDSGDTGGILADDWSTLDQRKVAMLEAYQWPGALAEQPGAEPAAQPTAEMASPPVLASTSLSVGDRWWIEPLPQVQPGTSSTPGPPPVLQAPAVQFAPGGPFDPDLQHVLQGVGGPNDPDSTHREARQRDEQLFLDAFGKPWQYAIYVTRATP